MAEEEVHGGVKPSGRDDYEEYGQVVHQGEAVEKHSQDKASYCFQTLCMWDAHQYTLCHYREIPHRFEIAYVQSRTQISNTHLKNIKGISWSSLMHVLISFLNKNTLIKAANLHGEK